MRSVGTDGRRRRVAHLMRRFGERSETFVVDAILEAERNGWEGWVVSQLPPANRDDFPYPDDSRLLRPRRGRETPVSDIANRMLRRPPRWRAASRLRPALRRVAPDLLHLHFGWTAADIALGRIDIPALVSFHGSDVTAWPHSRPAHRAMYAQVFGEIVGATATSRFIESRLRALGYTGPLDLLPAGVRLEQFPFRLPSTDGDEVRLLFVGRQVACKGLDVLIRALPSIRSPRTVSLEVIGDGEDAANARRLAETLGVARQVHFDGARPRAHVVQAMTGADILVVPSRVSQTGEAEGSPVAPKEALAIGMPVVATTVGGLPEVIPPEYRHELVAPDDPRALAAAIDRVVAERPRWGARARAGRAFVEQEFDWSLLGRRTTDIYDRTVEAARRNKTAHRAAPR